MEKPTPLLVQISFDILFGTVLVSMNLLGHGRHADSTNAPQEHNTGKEVARVGLGHEKVARQLADEITNVEN
jgi:hypothetical protein